MYFYLETQSVTLIDLCFDHLCNCSRFHRVPWFACLVGPFKHFKNSKKDRRVVFRAQAAAPWWGGGGEGHRFKAQAFARSCTREMPTWTWMLRKVAPFGIRVARWFVFKPKIQIWVNFGGSCDGICWYILGTPGPFYGLLLYFIDKWYSSW
jgi:hypothetical protein